MTTPLEVLAGTARACIHRGEAWSFLRTLPDHCVDAVITDPPYASGGASPTSPKASTSRKYVSSGSRRTFVDFAGDQRDQRSHFAWCVLWLTECLQIVRPGGALLCFTDWRQYPTFSDAIQCAGWNWKGIGVWDKATACRPVRDGFRAQSELVLYARAPGGRRRPPREATYLDGVLRIPVDREKVHIAGKPLALMRELVRLAPDDGIVLDPFAGSGTTGVAALESRRRFIGGELVDHYHAIASSRVEASALAAQSSEARARAARRLRRDLRDGARSRPAHHSDDDADAPLHRDAQGHPRRAWRGLRGVWRVDSICARRESGLGDGDRERAGVACGEPDAAL